MAPKSSNAFAVIVFLICTAIFASPAKARTMSMAAAAAAPDPFKAEDFSLFGCTSFVSEAMKCAVDVLKNAVAPHPSCCKAISKLNDCSSEFLKDIPSIDMVFIKGVCALWGVSIS